MAPKGFIYAVFVVDHKCVALLKKSMGGRIPWPPYMLGGRWLGCLGGPMTAWECVRREICDLDERGEI